MATTETTYGLTLANTLIALAGAGALAVAVWSWRGASRTARWWTGTPTSEWVVRAALPGWGLAVFCFGLGLLAGRDAFGWFAVPGILGLLGGLLGIIGLLPKWWAPRWYRRG